MTAPHHGELRRQPDGTFAGRIDLHHGWSFGLVGQAMEDAQGRFLAITGTKITIPDHDLLPGERDEDDEIAAEDAGAPSDRHAGREASPVPAEKRMP